MFQGSCVYNWKEKNGQSRKLKLSCILVVDTTVICLARNWECWHSHLHVLAALMK